MLFLLLLACETVSIAEIKANFMKKRDIIMMLLLGMSLFSCGLRKVHMQTMRPAPLTIPRDVQSVLLLDRSAPGNQTQAVIGAILSASFPGEREAGVRATLQNLQQQMNQSGRYNVRIATDNMIGSNLIANFPAPLHWRTVESLCKQYNTDAVIALEIYSNKFVVTDGMRDAVRKVKVNGREVERPTKEYYATGIATVDIGFRLYNLKEKQVFDEKIYSVKDTWESSGTQVRDALQQLIQKDEAFKVLSARAGQSYAGRISPAPLTISRNFYSKPRRDRFMSRASRQADNNDWQGAIATWEDGMASSNVKQAGRFAYNIAVGYEVIGDYETAREWAGIAWVDYGNKEARNYIRLIDRRIQKERLLMAQY